MNITIEFILINLIDLVQITVNFINQMVEVNDKGYMMAEDITQITQEVAFSHQTMAVEVDNHMVVGKVVVKKVINEMVVNLVVVNRDLKFHSKVLVIIRVIINCYH